MLMELLNNSNCNFYAIIKNTKNSKVDCFFFGRDDEKTIKLKLKTVNIYTSNIQVLSVHFKKDVPMKFIDEKKLIGSFKIDILFQLNELLNQGKNVEGFKNIVGHYSKIQRLIQGD